MYALFVHYVLSIICYVFTVVLCMYYGIMYVLLYYVCTVVLCIYYVLCMNYSSTKNEPYIERIYQMSS